MRSGKIPKIITPGLLPSVEFTTKRSVWTGREFYDADEVDALLDSCSYTINCLSKDNMRLEERADRADRRVDELVELVNELRGETRVQEKPLVSERETVD